MLRNGRLRMTQFELANYNLVKPDLTRKSRELDDSHRAFIAASMLGNELVSKVSPMTLMPQLVICSVLLQHAILDK